MSLLIQYLMIPQRETVASLKFQSNWLFMTSISNCQFPYDMKIKKKNQLQRKEGRNLQQLHHDPPLHADANNKIVLLCIFTEN